MNAAYAQIEPMRAAIDALRGAVVVEFGAPWCGYCSAAQSLLAEALAAHASVQHLKIEDGKGRRLGRSFQVKLWPTLIFLRNGQEVTRLVRPTDSHAISQALVRIEME